jgi:hypothetical protein
VPPKTTITNRTLNVCPIIQGSEIRPHLFRHSGHIGAEFVAGVNIPSIQKCDSYAADEFIFLPVGEDVVRDWNS